MRKRRFGYIRGWSVLTALRRSKKVIDDSGTGSARLSGCDVSIRVLPAMGASRGGDWCEAFVLPDATIIFSIGDVSGHGEAKFPAAVVLRKAIRRAVQSGKNPAEALESANRVLADYDVNEQATAVVARFDPSTEALVYANAGHPAPVLAGPGGASFLDSGAPDLSLGVEKMLLPALHTVRLPAGTLLVLYTDGVTERERLPLRGMAELLQAATFAYNFATLPSASVLERQMLLTGANADDAAILAAWMPVADRVA